MPSDIESLRDENERLRTRIAELEDALFSADAVPACLGLTRSESNMMRMLMARPMVTRRVLLGGLYSHLPKDERPNPQVFDVFVMRIRRKLRRFRIPIQTVRAKGWSLPPKSRARLRALAEKEADV
ncbi:winged helix-turn-helix domain-containing protein [Chelatococcus asaccharovorans]|uniref:Transcriptional regulator n=1 Tax=Chelatococcus asaccharovorans TaxID=28210 RepID=A0A2V3UAZ3_9HYPH|nr:winged helix-turn-helix domain-containing protein [Chelatococcus asaccharovorans]MBS7703276.1 winged helix-turn-helix domain-containing protein [Chelatococcus asaccharovorans]PXW61607.1 transcriptional regulator [Chelatococcus asaccharovorans]